MPAMSPRTPASSVGEGKPAVRWAWLMADRRRVRVATLWVAVKAVRYSANAAGGAGQAGIWRSPHQRSKSRQSAA